MNTVTINGFPTWQCLVGSVTQFSVITWAATELAARQQVAAWQEVPLHWVTAQQVGAL